MYLRHAEDKQAWGQAISRVLPTLQWEHAGSELSSDSLWRRRAVAPRRRCVRAPRLQVSVRTCVSISREAADHLCPLPQGCPLQRHLECPRALPHHFPLSWISFASLAFEKLHLGTCHCSLSTFHFLCRDQRVMVWNVEFCLLVIFCKTFSIKLKCTLKISLS